MSRRWPWLVAAAVAIAVAAWALWPRGSSSSSSSSSSAAAGGAAGAPAASSGAPPAAGGARVADGRPLAGATRREPAPTSDAPTELTGRIPAALDARVRGALARCAARIDVGAGARVFVYLTVAIAEQLTVEAVTSRGAAPPLEACLAEQLATTALAVPADAPRGRFQVTISEVVAPPPVGG